MVMLKNKRGSGMFVGDLLASDGTLGRRRVPEVTICRPPFKVLVTNAKPG